MSEAKVAAYYRVSSEEQRERQSILTQKENVRQFIKNKFSVKPVKEYFDDEISGSVLLERRDQGRKLIEDAKRGLFDTLVIWKLNRISRGGAHATLDVLIMLKNLGVRVISLHEDIDTSTAIGELMVAMQAFAGRLERDSLRTNVIAGQLRVAREGKWTSGRPPFGYVVNDDGTLAIQPEQAKIVQRVFALYLSGYGYHDIALKMNEDGIPPPSHWLLEPSRRKRKSRAVYRGKKARSWNVCVVENIVTKREYTGTFRFRKTEAVVENGERVRVRQRSEDEWIEYSVPVIVSEEDFNKAEHLREMKLRRPLDDARVYLLRGRIRCGACGAAMRGQSAGYVKRNGGKDDTTRYEYYRCSNAISRKGEPRTCRNLNVKAEPVEQLVRNFILNYLMQPNELINLVHQSVETNATQSEELRKRKLAVEEKLATIDEGRANILKLVAKGLITDQERDTALQETMDERNNLIRERTLIEEEMGTVGMDESAVRDAAEVLASVRDEWLSEEKSPEEWRWLIHQLIRSVTVFPETSYSDQFNGSGGKLRDIHIDCVFSVSEENLQLLEEQGDKVFGRQSPEDV